MNNLPRKIVTLLVAIFLGIQTCNGVFISNGLFAKYENTIGGNTTNGTLSYNIEVEVLKSPIITKYKSDIRNTKLINALENRGYDSTVHNYFGFQEGDIINYPFRIKQTYAIKNTTNAPIFLPISYSPLNNYSAFAYSYPLSKSAIQIGEDYGSKNVMLTQDRIFIPRKSKYVLNRDLGNKTIQLESNWNIEIEAGETSTVVLSYYATDLPKNSEIDGESYATYNFGGIAAAEPLYLPYQHTLILPKGFSATSSDASQEKIEGPYNGIIKLSEFGDIEIFTQ